MIYSNYLSHIYSIGPFVYQEIILYIICRKMGIRASCANMT